MRQTLKDKARALAIRAVKTFAEIAASMLTVGQAFGDVSWGEVISVAITAAIISVLLNIATGIPECSKEAIKDE